MPPQLVEASADEIKQGIKSVLAFYRLGCKSLRKIPGRMKYRGMEDEAEKFGVSPEHLRKARFAADADKGYTEAELDDLFEHCRQAQFAPGPSFVIRLLSVARGTRRLAIQRRAVKHRWSRAQLDTEIAKEFGTRRAGGRRRRIPSDPIGALVQLESLCEQWRRWLKSLSRKPDDELKITERDLPRPVRQQLDRVAEQIQQLNSLVTTELGKEKPRRMMRAARRDAAQPD